MYIYRIVTILSLSKSSKQSRGIKYTPFICHHRHSNFNFKLFNDVNCENDRHYYSVYRAEIIRYQIYMYRNTYMRCVHKPLCYGSFLYFHVSFSPLLKQL